MKKILVLLFASLFVSISSIASADLVFALVPKAMNNPFFDLARDGCKQAESEIDGVECLYIGPGEHTEQEQVQIVQDYNQNSQWLLTFFQGPYLPELLAFSE